MAFSQYLARQAADNGFAAAYVIDAEGRVLAKRRVGETAAVPGRRRRRPSRTPTPAATRWSCDPFERADLIRALYRLRGFPDAYLYVVRPVERGVFAHLRETEASLADYRQAKASRTAIQAGFFLIYLETVLVVLLGAVSVGMSAATSIAEPVARLVQAAGRVAAGDLAVRVETGDGPEEIAGLIPRFQQHDARS